MADQSNPMFVPTVAMSASLKKTIRRSAIKKHCVAVLSQIDKIETLRTSPDVICVCATIIENMARKKDKINKLELLIDAVQGLSGTVLTEPEKTAIRCTVEFLLSNKMVKATPWRFLLQRFLGVVGGLLSR